MQTEKHRAAVKHRALHLVPRRICSIPLSVRGRFIVPGRLKVAILSDFLSVATPST